MCDSGKRPLRPYYGCTLLMALLLLEANPRLVALLLGIPIGLVTADLSPAQAHVTYYTNLAYFLLVFLLKIGLGYLLLRMYLKKEERPQAFLALRRPQASDFPITLLGYLTIWIMSIFVFIFCRRFLGLKELEQEETLRKIFPFEGKFRWISLLIIGVIGPIWEELTFRGFMMGALTKRHRWTHGQTILVQGLCFGLIHMGYGSTSVLLATTMTGVVLGMARLQYRTTTIPIMIHIFNNTLYFFATCS